MVAVSLRGAALNRQGSVQYRFAYTGHTPGLMYVNMEEYKTTDYCLICGCSPQAGDHAVGRCRYVPPCGDLPTDLTSAELFLRSAYLLKYRW
jgi:hypothetical protein